MSETDLINRQVGGYRVAARVAAGGFGTIWKAQTPERKNVAIKLLHAPIARRRDARAAFENEYKLCRDFDHPGLLKYIDMGEFKKRPFVVMEFFRSVTLKSAIGGEEYGRMLAMAKKILVHVAEALDYIHDRGVVHCDLKPENILVNAKGAVKVIDFSAAMRGMAKWLPFGRKATGTPSYMSPEQIEKKTITPAADMYSLGALAFEFFTRRPPFTGNDQNEVLGKHLRAAPPLPSRFNKDLTPELDKLVQTMLAKDPKERPRDMKTLLFRLNNLQVFRE